MSDIVDHLGRCGRFGRKKCPPPLLAVDKALGAEFVRLAQRYGAYTVTTAAMRYITEAVEQARLKHCPTDDAWLRDLAQRFNQAMTAKALNALSADRHEPVARSSS